MKCYRVTVQPNGEVLKFKIAGAQAEARELRNELMNDFNCKKSDVTIEEDNIPTSKKELLHVINLIIDETYEAAIAAE